MLRIIITSLLMVSAIFWGICPPSNDSPHALLFKYFKIDYQPSWYFHLLLGNIFYILGVIVSQTKSINNIWF